MSKTAIKECILAMTQERFQKVNTILRKSGKDFNTVLEIGRLAAETDEQLNYRLLAIANENIDLPDNKDIDVPDDKVDFIVQTLSLSRDRVTELEAALCNLKAQLIHRGFKSDSATIFSINSVLGIK